MRAVVLILAGAAALAACAPVDPGAPGGPPPGPQTCDANAHRALIGTHVGAVSFPAGANVRVVCTTCPTTRDFRPDRLNVRFDQATGIIRRVDCG